MDFSREQRLAILILVGLGLAAIGVAGARRHVAGSQDVEYIRSAAGSEVSLPQDRPPRLRSGGTTSGPVAVHVAGHVKKPGFYTLDRGGRISDALKLAGGPTQDADLDAINLAAKLEDGVQIYVPSKKETKAAPSPQAIRTISKSPTPGPASQRVIAASSQQTGSKLTVPGDGSVNINTAGSAELQRLPGVGPATAEKILKHRAANGPFKAAEELMDVKGIGPAKLEKMRPFVEL